MMKTAQEYPWLKPLQTQWQHELAAQQLTSAMLVESTTGAGVEVLITELARSLVCENSPEGYCGLCHHCELSQISNDAPRGNHPDIHFIEPEAAGKSITVDKIREANQWALSSSQLGGLRVIVITPAEAMNESAANALLKTLETPPDSCRFILHSHAVHQLLPTIKSRCQISRVGRIDEDLALQWVFEQAGAQLDPLCFSMYLDAPIAALDFIQQGKNKQWQALLQVIENVCRGGMLPLTDIHQLFKEDTLEKIDWMMYLFHEVEKYHFGVSKIKHSPDFLSVVQVVSYHQAYRAYRRLTKLKQQMSYSTGLNVELLMTDFMIQLQKD